MRYVASLKHETTRQTTPIEDIWDKRVFGHGIIPPENLNQSSGTLKNATTINADVLSNYSVYYAVVCIGFDSGKRRGVIDKFPTCRGIKQAHPLMER
jgi:hypothetical protein